MRRRNKSSSNGSNWLATYSDLVTLLLCFFVLLFSFSTVDAKKFREIMNSFQGSTGVLNGGQTLEEMDYDNPQADELESENEELKEIKEYLEDYTTDNNLKGKVTMTLNERGLLIRTMDNVLFDSGKAEIKPESKEILIFIGDLLNKEELREKQVKVEGHTDDVIINSEKFPSNWELSVIRATNVLRLFVEQIGISPDRISASGYGPNRPIVKNHSTLNRSRNRRVDIIILKSKENKLEPK
ncbi:flagellar motor protein MotB [Senegalia massiliensis]|uniref:Flagellar motor protein MotB n=1 Tax=Senegalia massiliensis TaxID=1720316 RepID=A0A845QZF8_9CLOT|nr:flagellar motor protein MotB [Senegalia massiliensis]NBI07865.1 flagellar motor protein MotB [Senegalia massiliensis]